MGKSTWKGHWIGHSWMVDTSSERNQYYAFRKKIILDKEIENGELKITADSRYILWINGKFVSRGPARCFPEFQSYDSVNITSYLKQGVNWIAVLVHQFGVSNYQYVHRLRTGLLVDGYVQFRDKTEASILSDSNWEVKKASWFESSNTRYTLMLGYQERFNANKEEPNWKNPQVDYQVWEPAWYIGPVGTSPWLSMEKRGIPQLAEYETFPKQQPLFGIANLNQQSINRDENLRFGIEDVLKETVKTEGGLVLEEGWISIPATKENYYIVSVDYGHLITAYPIIEIQGSKNDIVDSYYSIYCKESSFPEVNSGFSTEREGVCDRFISKGGDEYWESYFPKGYQYHTVIIRGNSPLKIRIKAKQTHYPVQMSGHFESDDPILNDIWHISERTLRAGMLDAYLDNTWREQAQWLLDGVTASLAAHSLYGDTALIRRGLKQWSQMKMPDGSLYSVGPKDFAFMNLTDFNFAWINGLFNYYMNSDDMLFIKEMSDALKNIIQWIRNNITYENLFLSPEGHQVFLDWSEIQKKPYSLTLNLKLLLALQDAKKLFNYLDDHEFEVITSQLESKIRHEVERRFWDAKEKLWVERIEPREDIWSSYINRKQPNGWANIGPMKEVSYKYSQHGNAYALLVGLGSEEHRQNVKNWVAKSLDINQSFTNHASPMVFDQIISALLQERRSSSGIQGIKDWYGRELRLGVTTWPEQFGLAVQVDNDVPAAGNCGQTIGASTAHLISKYILGCSPITPGWKRFKFDPQLGSLNKAKGIVPTKEGAIQLELENDSRNQSVKAKLTIPREIVGEVTIEGKVIELTTGYHELIIK